ncbi:M14 family zinc carboxypeptidase [Acidobacteriota bacterium]
MFKKRIALCLSAIIPALFISLLAANGSFAQNVPAPEEILGFKVGADYHLASYQQAVEYFKALEKSSPKIRLFELGKTEMGKPMIGAIITSAENMGKLETFKEISTKLALAKGVTEKEANRLAIEGKAVVYIDGGLHASECAPAQHNIQLAYDLVTGQDSMTLAILDEVILLLVFANPDGMDLLAEWYHPNVGTSFEISRMPWVYNKYVGHDNNRDSFMQNMAETQNITLLTADWHPQILFNHHQTAPFPTRIWIHPTSEPVLPNIHPLLVRWQNLLGCAQGNLFDRKDQPGAVSRYLFDTWYPGYVTNSVDSRNIVSLLTETALYRYATPHYYTVNDFPEDYQDFLHSVFYPNPWKGGWWRLRDAVEYVLTASVATLDAAAKYSVDLLYDRYKMGKDVIERFKKEPPYAWIIPQQQWDAPTAALMLNKVKMTGVEVYKADEAFVADSIFYPAGTWIVPMDQAFALYVKNMFERQDYPDLGKYPDAWQGLVNPKRFADAYLPPYDVAGWTLPFQMHAKVSPVNSPLEVPMTRLGKIVPPAGAITGGGGSYLISPRSNNSFIAVNRILEKNGSVSRTRQTFRSGGKSYPPGTFVVSSGSVSRSFMSSLAEELALTIGAGSVSVQTFRLNAPRIALYKSWTASMDEGWTRWVFEQFEFPFTNIFDAEIRAGGLSKKFDVLVIPAMRTSDIVEGNNPGTVHEKYVGGISENGVKNIKMFIEEGGTLVTLNGGCDFPIDRLGIPVSNALKGLSPGRRSYGGTGQAQAVKFACPGSILRMNFDPQHPVAYGMPEEAGAVFTRSPAFDVSASFRDGKAPVVISKYPEENLLMSGWLLGEKYLINKAAAVEAPLGSGKVILLGFGVQTRAQPHGTFKLLFNSLFYGAVK